MKRRDFGNEVNLRRNQCISEQEAADSAIGSGSQVHTEVHLRSLSLSTAHSAGNDGEMVARNRGKKTASLKKKNAEIEVA